MSTLAHPNSELKNTCIVVGPPRVLNIANAADRAKMSPAAISAARKNGPRICRPQPHYVRLTNHVEPVFGVFAILLRFARVARSSVGDDGNGSGRHHHALASRALSGEAK